MNQAHLAFPELAEIIINELTDINISLTSPLLKTKVLAHRIQNRELLLWTNLEVAGYTDLEDVPEYRKTTGDIYSDYRTSRFIATDQYVAVNGDQELFRIYMTQGIQTLETYKSAFIGQTFEGEDKKALVANLSAQHENFQISRIYKKIPSNFISEILTHVRTKLLDVLLEMEEKYGYISNIKELKAHNSAITHIVQTNIHNFGDANLINAAPHSKIIADIKTSKNNLS